MPLQDEGNSFGFNCYQYSCDCFRKPFVLETNIITYSLRAVARMMDFYKTVLNCPNIIYYAMKESSQHF